MIEKWHIVWFCLTLTNPECVAKDNTTWGISSGPFTYPSEDLCINHAEGIATAFWNEKKFKVEYACRRQKDWEPYVPRRRP